MDAKQLAVECGIILPAATAAAPDDWKEEQGQGPYFGVAAQLFPASLAKDRAFRQKLKSPETKTAWVKMWTAHHCDLRLAPAAQVQKLLDPVPEKKQQDKENAKLKAFLLAFEQEAPVTQARVAAANTAFATLQDPTALKTKFPDGVAAAAAAAHPDFQMFKDNLRLYQALQSFA